MDIKAYLLSEYNDIIIDQAFELTNEIKQDICTVRRT